jgi:hypothetical protein
MARVAEMLERIGRSVAVLLLFGLLSIVAIGERGMREHAIRAKIRTPATPVALFGALLDVEALRGEPENPGYGRLLDVTWSKSPSRQAHVLERYERGVQSYQVVDWSPPQVIEERYDLAPMLDREMIENLSDLRQRWTAYALPDGTTAFGMEHIMVPKTIALGLELELAGDNNEKMEKSLGEILQRIADYAVAHPRTSTTAIIQSVRVGDLAALAPAPTATRAAALP